LSDEVRVGLALAATCIGLALVVDWVVRVLQAPAPQEEA
jgi:hypothetical protein